MVCSHRAPSLAGESRFAAAVERVPDPLRESTAFVAAIRDLIERWQPALVVPVTDQSCLALLSADPIVRARVPGPDREAFQGATDKSAVLRAAGAVGIATPRQHVVFEPGSPGLGAAMAGVRPLVLKSAHPVAAGQRHLVRYAEEAAEADRVLAALDRSAYPVLVQQRIVGPAVGIFLLVWEGAIRAAFAHQRVREMPPSGGRSVCADAIPLQPELVERSRALLAQLGWRGVAMVEYKVDAGTGVPYLMEVNGRFWGSLQLAVHAGVDFPALLVDAALGTIGGPLPTYRVGARLRCWWGDVDHLLARMRHSPERLDLPPGAPSRWEVLRDFALPHRDTSWDVLQATDLRPFLLETREWLSGRLLR